MFGLGGSRSRSFTKEMIVGRGFKFGRGWLFLVCGGKCIFYGVKFECLAGSLSLSRFKDN